MSIIIPRSGLHRRLGALAIGAMVTTLLVATACERKVRLRVRIETADSGLATTTSTPANPDRP